MFADHVHIGGMKPLSDLFVLFFGILYPGAVGVHIVLRGAQRGVAAGDHAIVRIVFAHDLGKLAERALDIRQSDAVGRIARTAVV